MTSKVLSLFCFILLSTVAVASLYSTTQSQEETKSAPPKETTSTSSELDSHLFDNIVDRIKEDYVEKVSDQKLLEGALNGMLSSLDPHSAYLDPKAYEELKIKTKAEYGGLGMEVTMENGVVKIISPIDDTPAQKAGLQAGDLIYAIDKKPVTGMTLNEAVELLRGKAGTTVRLHIKRDGKDVFEKTLTRENIHVKAVKWHEEGNVGYIRIATFNDSTTPLLKEAITDIKKKLGNKLEGYVIDVRNDPGGLLDVAISASNLFLTKGEEIVATRGRNPKMDETVYADASDTTNGLPIVVLINQGSASASEILAGALQDNHRALVVGTKSFGKGSVQVVMPLTNGGAIILTTARYYTPSGRTIQAKGIEPDIVIEQVQNKLEKVDENDFLREKDFVGALDTNQAKKPSTSAEKEQPAAQKKQEGAEKLETDEEKKKKEVQDYQLMRAVDIVRTMSITQKYDKQICKTKK
jgi:carboxyl-terminal processing protease